MKIQILHRFSLAVLFEHDQDENSISITIQAAIKAKANLRSANLRSANLSSADLRSANLSSADLRSANLSGADLRGANLRSANLRSADLSGADLSGAYLSDADLSGADLRSANLSGADLRGADLSGAYLSGADLRCADLSGADLIDANLSDADLSGADLRSANLSGAYLLPIKADFIEVISQAPREVPALIAALAEGRVDGSTYSGECSCLVGTIANAKGMTVDSLEFNIPQDSSRPAERFFMGIRKGDKPETNQVSAIALEWAKDWYATVSAAFQSN